jgi:hypothetical protein
MIGATRVFKDGSCQTTVEWLDIHTREKNFRRVMQDAFGIDRRGAPAPRGPSEPEGGGEAEPED